MQLGSKIIDVVFLQKAGKFHTTTMMKHSGLAEHFPDRNKKNPKHLQ